MSQEAPNEEEEEETVRVEIEGAFDSEVIEPNNISELTDQTYKEKLLTGTEDATEEIEAHLEVNRDTDEKEVAQAIQRINSVTRTPGATSDRSQTAVETIEGLYNEDRLRAMRELLEEHNLRIVQQLLASDTGALSPQEVAFRNEGIISESTVRDHLRGLVESGFVKRLEPDVESVPNKMPRTFYAASPLAIELLEDMGLWENLGMLYQIYDSLERSEKIEQIEAWERRPTPDWI